MTHPLAAVQPRTCVVCGWRALTPAQNHVCTLCERQIRQHLLDLTDLALLLPAAVAPPSGTERGLPIRTSVLDLRLPARTRPVRSTGAEDATGESIAEVLGDWAVRWSEYAPRIAYRPSNSVGSIALWLWEQLHWAVTVNPGIDRMAQDVRDLVASARWALNTTGNPSRTSTALVRYTAPCRRCGSTSLFCHPGADWIECQDCGSLYSEAEYAELARQELDGDTLLYASQAAVALGVPVDRVWKWASRRMLEEVDHEGGRPRYRLSDLRDVHRQSVLHRANRCEIGLVVVTEAGEIVPGPLTEYAAPATVAVSTLVTVTTEDGQEVEQLAWHAITVRRGETRWVGPAREDAIVVQEADAPARVREVVKA